MHFLKILFFFNSVLWTGPAVVLYLGALFNGGGLKAEEPP